MSILNWTDNSENEKGFIVEQKSRAEIWQQVVDLPENTTEYADATLNCEKSYGYRVKAHNSYGESDYSNVVSIITSACWSWTVVDSAAENPDISIAVDSNEKVHISYNDQANNILKIYSNMLQTAPALGKYLR